MRVWKTSFIFVQTGFHVKTGYPGDLKRSSEIINADLSTFLYDLHAISFAGQPVKNSVHMESKKRQYSL